MNYISGLESSLPEASCVHDDPGDRLHDGKLGAQAEGEEHQEKEHRPVRRSSRMFQ